MALWNVRRSAFSFRTCVTRLLKSSSESFRKSGSVILSGIEFCAADPLEVRQPVLRDFIERSPFFIIFQSPAFDSQRDHGTDLGRICGPGAAVERHVAPGQASANGLADHLLEKPGEIVRGGHQNNSS